MVGELYERTASNDTQISGLFSDKEPSPSQPSGNVTISASNWLQVITSRILQLELRVSGLETAALSTPAIFNGTIIGRDAPMLAIREVMYTLRGDVFRPAAEWPNVADDYNYQAYYLGSRWSIRSMHDESYGGSDLHKDPPWERERYTYVFPRQLNAIIRGYTSSGTETWADGAAFAAGTWVMADASSPTLRSTQLHSLEDVSIPSIPSSMDTDQIVWQFGTRNTAGEIAIPAAQLVIQAAASVLSSIVSGLASEVVSGLISGFGLPGTIVDWSDANFKAILESKLKNLIAQASLRSIPDVEVTVGAQIIDQASTYVIVVEGGTTRTATYGNLHPHGVFYDTVPPYVNIKRVQTQAILRTSDVSDTTYLAAATVPPNKGRIHYSLTGLSRGHDLQRWRYWVTTQTEPMKIGHYIQRITDGYGEMHTFNWTIPGPTVVNAPRFDLNVALPAENSEGETIDLYTIELGGVERPFLFFDTDTWYSSTSSL
jgi:hypothetical protein